MRSQKSQRATMEHCRVVLYGRCGALQEQWERASLFARNLGGTSTCGIIEPDQRDAELQFSVLARHPGQSIIGTQGMVMDTRGQTAVIESLDDPIVVIEHLDNGRVVVLRVGKDQLINPFECCQKTGVIEKVIPDLGRLDGQKLRAYITGGISARHLTHNDYKDVSPFVDMFGPEVLISNETLGLNLRYAIGCVLKKYGVPEKNIKSDCLCTCETPWLGSTLANKPEANWIVVVMK